MNILSRGTLANYVPLQPIESAEDEHLFADSALTREIERAKSARQRDEVLELEKRHQKLGRKLGNLAALKLRTEGSDATAVERHMGHYERALRHAGSWEEEIDIYNTAVRDAIIIGRSFLAQAWLMRKDARSIFMGLPVLGMPPPTIEEALEAAFEDFRLPDPQPDWNDQP